MVKLHTPLGNSNKLSPKFTGPFKIIAPDSGNKFKVQHLETSDISLRHADELKQTNMNEIDEHTLIDSDEAGNTDTDKAESETNHVETGTDRTKSETSHTASNSESHAYRMKLRSHNQVLPLTCISETSLETEFYKCVEDILDELNIDCYSFYR